MTTYPKEFISTAHANTILDSVADGVFTVDRDLRITFFNQAAERITGIPRGDAMGQFCFEVFQANVCEKTCSLKCSFETGKETVNRHVNILRADGKEIPISISTAVLKDEKGDTIGGVETFRDLSIIEELKQEIKRSYTFKDIISKNYQILKIFDILPNIATSGSTVLIQGSSGTGKELFARAIHNLSPRKKEPFLAVSCGALPESLLESELFGYVKGAFTDAKKDKLGRFSLAQGGTIFLDEVDSLSQATQMKLLRVLQEKEFEPLGAVAPVKADVRFIAATRENLSNLVEKGTFRDDLYFRLNVVLLKLPPLSQRRDDIPLLIDHFIEKFNLKMSRNISGISNNALRVLIQYEFPGNVRQLENIIEHAFVMCQSEIININHLPPEFYHFQRSSIKTSLEQTPLQQAERQTILHSLEKHNWNKSETAKEIGVHRTTLWRKMKKYGLN